ncbi:MAG: hypothetical protein ETSY1_15075 [Candidatus Entotheonella factor]|uniref:Flavin reductase like domain-containing protein n=1 Tax=Entotheonella factor TaxID=1429438 RepID=W4LPS9_ENTF1|nr:MAG: hypothetical protein ETSY1_15075 [Candidatus Entotheonella factor]
MCTGYTEPEEEVTIILRGWGMPRDVTRNCVPVSLRPFTIASAVNEPTLLTPRSHKLELILHARHTPNRLLGRIQLRVNRLLPLSSASIVCFETVGFANYVLPPVQRHLLHLYHHWQLLRDRNPHNLKMVPSQLMALYVLYLSPRPVVLVSYAHEDRGNIIPMDLAGPTDSPYVLLGLHRTSPAIPLLTAGHKIAISTLPVDYRATVFAMGPHHRQASIDLSTVPMPLTPSSAYGLPVPEVAITVREVEVEHVEDFGTHRLLVTRQRACENRSSGLQMCHTPWFSQNLSQPV